jgi:RimJ/RimL family protein N-acetyltransferase
MGPARSAVEALCGAATSPRLRVPVATERLILRTFEEADADSLSELMGDGDATKYIGGTKSRSAAADSVRYMRDAFVSRGWGTLAVVLSSNAECIGYCGVRPLLNTPDVELAFALKRSTWNRGYASEAAKASLDLAFKHLSVDRVVATVYPENLASIRVLTKLGMLRQGSIFGAWPNNTALFYSLRRDTWKTGAVQAL